MPARLKILVFVFVAFALTNAGNAVLIALRQDYSAWLARVVLSIAVSGAYAACAWLVCRKKKEAIWFSTIFVGVMMAMIFGPFLYRFFAFVSERSATGLFTADLQMHWVRAGVYLLFVLTIPFLVHRLLSSKKSVAWFQT